MYRLIVLVCVVALWAPALAFAQPARLTESALDSAIYRPSNTPPFPDTVQLADGAFKGPEYTDIHQQSYVFGDLNGDGQEDAVAMVVESLSGVAAGLDVRLGVYVDDGGVPRFVDSVGLGHATGVESVTIRSGVITASGKYVGPNDGFCCPAQPFTVQIKVDGDHLADLNGKCLSCSQTGSSEASAPAETSAPAEPSAPAEASAAPSALTSAVRADILAAIDRANAAWTDAGATLDDSGLENVVAGQALSDDQAELDALRAAGHVRKSTNEAFSVTGVTLDAPGHAIVTTRETWSEQLEDAASGRVIQPPRSASYTETYVVEFLNGGWIVTRNDL